MLWFLVLCLFAWTVWLTLQVGVLKARAERLERRVIELKERQEATAPSAAPEPIRKPQPQRAPEPVPSLERELKALVGLAAPAPAAARVEAPEPSVAAPPPKPSGPPPREVIRAWLEENGLAWAGGAALALGGIFLVAYAAQRGVFAPPMRIGAAVVIGVLLLGVSEWLKRRVDNPLAAALAAGAAAATLYGAAWASYWLYAFIGVGTSGALLGVISLGLLGLAFRHGEPLAVLAILGGFLAPAVTGPEQWTAPALTAYLGLIALTGYGVTAARRWGQTGLATLAGAFLWGFAGFGAEGYVRVVALALAPLVLGSAAVAWRQRRGEAVIADGSLTSFTLVPIAALAAAAILLASLWAAVADPTALHAAGAGAALAALIAAVAARRGLIPPILQVLGWLPALAILLLFLRSAGDAGLREGWTGGLIGVLALAGAISATGSKDAAGRFGAAGAALVALILALTLSGPLTTAAPWAPTAAAAVILLAAGAVIARRSAEPQTDLPMALWIWSAGAVGLFALQQGIDPRYLPAAAAALSLAGAVAHARLGWRGFAGVMLAGATASLAALMSPVLFRALTDARFDWWALALVAALSVALTYAGAWIARRASRPRESAEAQGTAALLLGVVAIGVLLRLAATGGALHGGGGIDRFLEAGLRTVTILVAGLISAQAVRADSSVIGRWRGQALLLAGLFHGLVFQAVGLNPLWADWKPPVAGPPLFDSLAVGFLAPAALLALATWKKVSVNRTLLAIYAIAAALFLGLWEVMEVRRLFQGASLYAGFDSIGRAEASAYAVLALVGARAAIWLGERAADRPWTVSAFAREIVQAGRFGTWAALILALLVFGYGASPWWGPIDRPLAGVRATALLFGLYAAGGAGAFLLVQPAVRAGDLLLARAARMTTVVVAFALLNLVVRLGFRGFDMRPTLAEASLETWTFSAAWGLYGFGLLVYGAARRSNDLRLAGLVALMVTLAKIFLFDMANLEGVVRAGSFLAVGALLLAAAVLVRKLGGQRSPEAASDS